MEAVPKLPFIHFPLKTSPEPADFATPIKRYIQGYLGEQPELYSKEIAELQSLRQSACRVPRDFTGCSTLKKYYAQLHLLHKRFPMKHGEYASVLFTWAHAYNPSSVSSEANILYEQGCVLYNIGALHSELGAMDSRQSSEGMKMSCTHFQCAAWAFQHLRDAEFSFSSADLTCAMLTFNMNVMLGQAQECILEKSMLDNRKSTIVAKISAQIVEYYKEAIKILDNDPNPTANIVGSKLAKSWHKHLEFKIAYHNCVTLLYMGNQADELQKMGERVAYLQGALEKLNEAAKLAKGLDKDVSDSILFTMDVVGGKLNAASKENEFVYHEKVPSLDSLPDVKGASLVKGIPFDPDDLEISGPDVFARLVPIEAHESSSLYSEEKAKILRRVSATISEKDDELRVFLSCLQLDQLKLMPESERLPQELVDCCAAMSVRPTAVKQLISNMKELAGKYHDVDSLLAEIKELLVEEAKREKEYQALTGHRPTSMIITEISKELEKYEEAHEKAGESNVTLHKAMDYHITNLNILSGSLDQLSKTLPSLDSIDLGDSGIAKEFQRLLDKVEEMQNQRKMLETLLREQLQADDITKKLATTDNNKIKELFIKEIQKHESQISYIEHNLAAQTNILKAITEANARYADTRKAVTEITQRREAMIRSLCSSFEAYEDLNTKSLKGLEFYRKLETNVTKLLQRLRSVCDVQEEERSAILKKKQPKKDPAAEKLAVTGPKLRDFLKFGSKNVMPNEISSTSAGAGYISESYVPQYYNYRQQMIDVPPATTQYNLPSLPSELRPQPVGSEKNEPTSCTVSQLPHPSATPPISTDYYSSCQTTGLDSQIQINYGLPNWCQQSNFKSEKMATPVTVPQQQSVISNSTVSTSGYSSNTIQTPQSGYNSSAAMYAPLSSTYSDYHTISSSGNEINYQSANMYSMNNQQQLTVSHGPYSSGTFGTTSSPLFDSGYQTQLQYSSENEPSYSGVSRHTFNSKSQPFYSVVSNPAAQPQYSSGIQQPISSYSSASQSPYRAVSEAQNITGVQLQYNSGSQTQNTNGSQHLYSSGIQPQAISYSSGVHPQHSFGSQQQMTAYDSGSQQQMAAYDSGSQQQMAAYDSGSQQQMTAYDSGSQQQMTYDSGSQQQMTYDSGSQQQMAYGSGSQQQMAYGSGSQQQMPSYGSGSQQQMPSYDSGSQQQMPSYDSGSQQQMPSYDSGSQSHYSAVSQAQCNLGTPMQYSSVVQPQSHYNSLSKPEHNSGAPSHYGEPDQPLQPQVLYYQQPLQPTAVSEADPIPNSVQLAPTLPVATVKTNASSNVELLKQLSLMDEQQQISNSVTSNNVNSKKSAKSPGANILKPKVLSVEELIKHPVVSDKSSALKDPFSECSLPKFVSEVERFQKGVEGLTKPSLNGLTPLEQKWKELLDLQDKESKKLSISVARCYSMRNRVPDIMPYDSNRVFLTASHDDYINASHLQNLTKHSAQYIATQAPVLATFKDFWLMVYEQQAEIVVAILSDAELRGDMYWPKDKGFSVEHGNLTISIRNINSKSWGVERVISVSHRETKISRTVMHLQFTAWPPGGLPTSPALFLQFISDVHTHYSEQRNSFRPIVVHCSAGVGRTGVFCLVSTSVFEINAGNGIFDMWVLAGRLCQMRKYIMQDKEHMKFALHTLLYYAEECLLKRGILIKRASFDEKGTATVTSKSHTRHPSQDFIISKVSDEPNVESDESEKQANRSRSGSNASIASFASSGSGTAGNVSTTPTHKPIPQPVIISHKQPPLTTATSHVFPPVFSHLDPENFTLEPISMQKQNKITKESFLNPSNSGVRDRQPDPNDPLSQLDPLWSLTNKK